VHVVTTLHQRLKAALPAAMKARDKAAVAALRSALAAIDNAAAVPASPTAAVPASPTAAAEAGPFAKAVLGVGAAEAARRDHSEADIEKIVRAEIDDRHTAAAEYDRLGHPDTAATKRAEASALQNHLAWRGVA
jgi:uncharacterized protein